MKGIYTIKEIAQSTYYRRRPLEALGFLYSKWQFAQNQTADYRLVLQALGLNPEACLEGYDKWAEVLEGVVADAGRLPGQGGINLPEGLFLYGATRALRPEVVIETGVAAGVSSCFFIAALIENARGTLYSVDLPAGGAPFVCSDAAQYDWPRRGVGWAIPPQMRSQIGERHVLVLNDVRQGLPQILDAISHVDIFFHDDLHVPDHMLWEYELVWPRLRTGGILASHDANMAWIRFCDQRGLPRERRLNLNRLCAARKN
jgi:hypothetical protein